MDFLEQLYSMDNFGLYLVIAIAVLVVLFFIVLFMGSKDKKQSKKQNEVVENNEPKPTVVEAPTPVEPIKPVEPVNPDLEPTMIIPNNEVKPEPVVFTPVESTPTPSVENNVQAFKEVSEEKPLEVKEPPKEEKTENVVLNEEVKEEKEVIDEHKEFDFDALAEAINKELESFKESKPVEQPISKPVKEEVKPVIEEKKFTFPTFETVEPDKIPEPMMNTELKEVKPVIEEKPKPVMPNVFSSVYVNRDKVEEKPVKPAAFELPKMADLPKKAEVKEPEIHSVFDSIEEESYQINK